MLRYSGSGFRRCSRRPPGVGEADEHDLLAHAVCDARLGEGGASRGLQEDYRVALPQGLHLGLENLRYQGIVLPVRHGAAELLDPLDDGRPRGEVRAALQKQPCKSFVSVTDDAPRWASDTVNLQKEEEEEGSTHDHPQNDTLFQIFRTSTA